MIRHRPLQYRADKQHVTPTTLGRAHGKRQRGRYDATWMRFRVAYLSDHPYCQDCEARGELRIATEVHHVQRLAERPDLRLDEANMLGLCRGCHSRRTAKGE